MAPWAHYMLNFSQVSIYYLAIMSHSNRIANRHQCRAKLGVQESSKHLDSLLSSVFCHLSKGLYVSLVKDW